MFEELLDVILDSLIDGIKLLPFLFIAFLVMEFIEHKTSKHVNELVKKSGKFGPFIGGVLGVFPQCGFSAAAANLYAGKIITMGTLIAIFLSTSDEMLPVLISENASVSFILQVLGIKLVIGILAGFLIDLFINLINKNKKKKSMDKKVLDEETVEEEIGHLCEHEHCECDHDGILKSSIKHTLSIFAFILIITVLINILIYFIGKDNLANLILNKPVIGPLLAAIIGLIPNCAGSVILTQLNLSGVLSLGSMISGLLVGSGIGILVLFKVNKNLKNNLIILGILYVIGVICGIIIDLIVH